nr:13554_t:CDS:2 [Entrophospora candida]
MEDPSANNQLQSRKFDTSIIRILPSKCVGETKSVNKPTGKKPKAVNREDPSNLRKLINELSSTEKLPQFTGRDYRRDKIDRDESRNDVTNREDNGKVGSRALIKEIWKQIPEEITDVALRKAMKIYNNMLFTEDIDFVMSENKNAM